MDIKKLDIAAILEKWSTPARVRCEPYNAMLEIETLCHYLVDLEIQMKRIEDHVQVLESAFPKQRQLANLATPQIES